MDKPKDPQLRRCPYCAEEIYKEAIWCKHCDRKVRRRWIKFCVVGVIAVGCFLWVITHQVEVRSFMAYCRQLVQDVSDMWSTLKDVLHDMRHGAVSLKDHQRAADVLKDALSTGSTPS